MAAFFLSLLAGWDTASRIAGAVFVMLMLVFLARAAYRKFRGASWPEAFGRAVPDHQ